MKRDNEAFAAECEQSTGEMDLDNPQEMVRQDGAILRPEPFQSPQKGDDMSKNDEISEMEMTSYGQEMQERSGSNLLGARPGNTATSTALTHALDDDEEWKTIESDEEMADHVENARTT